MDFGIFNWTILRVERGATPKKQGRSLFDPETSRNYPVSRHRQKLFAGMVGHDARFLFDKRIKRPPKIFFTGKFEPGMKPRPRLQDGPVIPSADLVQTFDHSSKRQLESVGNFTLGDFFRDLQ